MHIHNYHFMTLIFNIENVRLISKELFYSFLALMI